MNVFFSLGDKLAQLTGQEEAIMIGLHGLAVKDLNTGKDPKNISYLEARKAFDIYLRVRLKKINLANSDQIADQMLDILEQKQSLFTMSIK